MRVLVLCLQPSARSISALVREISDDPPDAIEDAAAKELRDRSTRRAEHGRGSCRNAPAKKRPCRRHQRRCRPCRLSGGGFKQPPRAQRLKGCVSDGKCACGASAGAELQDRVAMMAKTLGSAMNALAHALFFVAATLVGLGCERSA